MAFDPERSIRWLAPLGAAGLVVGIGINRWWSYIIAAFGLLILLLACRSLNDGFLFLGPFVKQELVSLVRRSRFYAWRAFALTIAVLAFLGAAWVRYYYSSPFAVQMAGTILVLASGYILMLVVLPSTTQLLLSTISGEREANRLDFLLVTDLRNREIVIGRTVTRVLPLFAHLFILFPFAMAVSPFFGVPFEFITVLMAFLALTAFSLSGIVVLASTLAATTKRTNPIVGFITVPFIAFTGALDLLRSKPWIWDYVVSLPGGMSFVLGDALEYVTIASPIGVIVNIMAELVSGANPIDSMLQWLPIYAAYQLAFGFIGYFLAARWLRSASARLAGQGAIGATKEGGRQLEKPVVGDRPVFWKEKHFHELLPKTKKTLWIYRIVGFCLSYLPGIFVLIIGIYGDDLSRRGAKNLLGGALPLIAWVFLCVGFRISGAAIARERERDTLTSLIMTPILPQQIIAEKWQGAYLTQFGGVIWILILGVPAVITGLYPLVPLIALLILTVSFLAVSTSIGLLASITATKTEKANQNAILRGALGLVVQVLIAIVPLVLAGMKILPYGINIAIVICPLISLVFAGFAALEPTDPAEILITASLAAIHMGIIAWLVYRRARNKFTAMCDDGTIDSIKS